MAEDLDGELVGEEATEVTEGTEVEGGGVRGRCSVMGRLISSMETEERRDEKEFRGRRYEGVCEDGLLIQAEEAPSGVIR